MLKFIALTLVFMISASSFADEYSIDHIISVEQRLNELNSQIHRVDKATIERIKNFSPALYYLKQGLWEKSLNLLPADTNGATDKDNHYQNILRGVSLLGDGRTREAFAYFSRVPYGSELYVIAQLNSALLFLHDDSIDRSIQIINALLADPALQLSDPLKNKILVTLGYVYFKNQQYQHSRETFRTIEIDSIYSNRALLGIALNALELKDYDAAQNTLSVLKNSKIRDLASDESYILSAFIYESQERYSEGSTAYREAIEYYGKRIASIEDLLENDEHFGIEEIIDNHVFVISRNSLDGLELLPITFFNNFMISEQLLQALAMIGGKENTIYKRAYVLNSDYRAIINQLLIDLLTKRKERLIDYLNQVKYRLARSYDNSNNSRVE